MMSHTIALFGEAERGEFSKAYYCTKLEQLSDMFGEPPSQDAKGLQFAVQALLYHHHVIFFRVREEGFSIPDYLTGLHLLERKDHFPALSAICLPGVGSNEIIEASTSICTTYKTFLIITESDLYDYLTCA